MAIEDHEVETPMVRVVGYYERGPRPAGFVTLRGRGHAGRGENVGWTSAEQAAFAAAFVQRAPQGETTVGEVAAALVDAHSYHRAAIEGAAIDLALKQGNTNIFVKAARDPRPVSFCWSLHDERDPVSAIEDVAAHCPTARVKIDVPEKGWPNSVWDALAATERVVILDFKRRGRAGEVLVAHERMPEAWIEDPPLTALARYGSGEWTRRVALDGWVTQVPDAEWPPLPPGAVNVKAPRVGGWLEALRLLEICDAEGWHAYVGGMFEVGPGREQARVLASLFTADAWNDLAPIRPGSDAPYAATPISVDGNFTGFAPPETGRSRRA